MLFQSSLVKRSNENSVIGSRLRQAFLSIFFLTLTGIFTSELYGQNNPVFTSTPATSVNERGSYDYAIVTDDQDEDQVTVTALTKPAWLSLNSLVGNSVTTFAGSGSAETTDGTGVAASFNVLQGIATDLAGNIYVTEIGDFFSENHVVRKISPSGVVTTFAGSGNRGSADGTGTLADFNNPVGMATDASGNLYVADRGNHRIRKISPAGVVTTFAGSGNRGSIDGTGLTASFSSPSAVATDASGNIYVGDIGNHKIRKISPSGVVTTLAGSGNRGSFDGAGTAASFNSPAGLAVDTEGNVYVADEDNNRIRKITPSGVVSTLAGRSRGDLDGTGSLARFYSPYDLAVDVLGNVFVADRNNHKIKKITPSGVVTTLAGSGSYGSTDGVGTAANLASPLGIALDAFGNAYIAESGNKVRRILRGAYQLSGDPTGQVGNHAVTLEANDGNGGSVQQSFSIQVLAAPTVTTSTATGITGNEATLQGEVVTEGGAAVIERGFVYALTTDNDAPGLDKVDGTTVIKVPVAGTSGVFNTQLSGLAGNTQYSFIAYADNGGLTEGTVQTFITLNNEPDFTSVAPTTVSERGAYSYNIITDDADGDPVTVSALTKPNWLNLKSLVGNRVTTLAGSGSAGTADGTGTAASFSSPQGIATDLAGNIYVTEIGDFFGENHVVRKISPAGVVTTFAGSGNRGSANGTGTAAGFNNPVGMAADASGNIYVADAGNNRIRKISPAGVVTTFAGSGNRGSFDGTGLTASFSFPSAIAIDASGNIYVSDLVNNKIRKITPSGVVTTLAGSGNRGSFDGAGTAASFNSPAGLAVDTEGNVYVADGGNYRIRKITSSGVVSTLAGSYRGDIDGTGSQARFSSPNDVTIDVLGNVFVTDRNNNKIKKITPSGVVTTVAGSGSYESTDGIGTTAGFSGPVGIALDAFGNAYVAESGNKIRKILSGQSLLAGDPTGQVGNHSVILEANDGKGGTAQQSFTIDVIAAPTVTTEVAVSISATGATLQGEVVAEGGATITERGFVYSRTADDASPTLAEVNESTVLKVEVSGTTGNFDAALSDLSGNTEYSFIAYATNGGATEGSVQTFTTLNNEPTITSSALTSINEKITYTYQVDTEDIDGDQVMVTASTKPAWLSLIPVAGNTVTTLTGLGNIDGTGTTASFISPRAVAADLAGNIYIADSRDAAGGTGDGGDYLIFKITPSGAVTTLAGSGFGSADGTGTNARFNDPRGLAVDASGNVYVADRGNSKIRKISPSGVVVTFAGSLFPGDSDGTGTTARFNDPVGIAVDAAGNVYVGDTNNNKIRKISPSGVVTTLAGTGSRGSVDGAGTVASFNSPREIVVDSSGNVFVADSENDRIRKITPSGLVSTFAGSSRGSNDGTGTTARFNRPTAVALDAQGNLFVTDALNNRIRQVSPDGVVSTIAGSGSAISLDGTGTTAGFNSPTRIAFDAFGNAYVLETGNKIRKMLREAYLLTGDPAGQVGNHNVVLEASDGKGGTAQQSFTIEVIAAPAVTTGVATAIAANGVTLHGEVTSQGGAAITQRGFVYARTADDASPTLAEVNGTTVFKAEVPGTVGTFDLAVNTLAGNTVYSFVAYADNGGTTEGGVQTFTTLNNEPAFSSTAPVSINEGKTYAYSVITEDLDGDQITVSAPTIPDWLKLVPIAGNKVTTVAGSGSSGSADGTGTAAGFFSPERVAVDLAGNIYISDRGNLKIRKVSPSGVVTTLAGSGSESSIDGTGTDASFDQPAGIAVDASGNVYVVDKDDHSIRKISPSGVVTTFAGSGRSGSADGTGTEATFDEPSGIAIDASGNLYIGDTDNHKIRKISPSGVVSTLAGSGVRGSADGTGTDATFRFPDGIAVDSSGNVYVADVGNERIRIISPDKVVSTLAGSFQGSSDGTGTNARFSAPHDITVDPSGNVFVADRFNNKIRKISPSGVVTTVAGSGNAVNLDGTGTAAGFNAPRGIAFGPVGNIYIVDDGHQVRKISNESYELTGNSAGRAGNHNVVLEANDLKGGIVQQSFTIEVIAAPTVVTSEAAAISADGATLQGEVTAEGGAAIAERGFVYARTADDATPTLAEVNGTTIFKVNVPGTSGTFDLAISGLAGNTGYSFIAYADNGGVTEGSVKTFNTLNNEPTFTSTAPTAISERATYTYPIVTEDADGDVITITALTKPDWLTLAPLVGDEVTTFAGSGDFGNTDGTGTAASFFGPSGMALDTSGNLYIADTDNHLIRKISPSGVVTTFAGSGNEGSADGTGTNASFDGPRGMALDASGNLYVADTNHHLIRKISPSGVVSTLAGGGTEEGFAFPEDLAVDASGNVFVADGINHKIRKITPAGVVTTFAGSGNEGSVDGTGTAADFHRPKGITLDKSGNVYVADTGNHRIRKISPSGVVTTLAGSLPGFNNGTGTQARFFGPLGLAVDALGNVFVADGANNRIRKVSPSGVVSTVAGSGNRSSLDGVGTRASFYHPAGIALDASGNAYVTDRNSRKIRKIAGDSYLLTGDPTGQAGNHNVVLQASDDNGGVTQQNFTIEVIAAPTVTTNQAVSISFNEAILQGEVTSQGGAAITERGFVYARTSDDATPTLSEVNGSTVLKVAVPGTVGTFDMAVNNLMGHTDYSFIAYADNGGLTEGTVQTFTTLNNVPVFNSTALTSINEANTYSYLATTQDADGDPVAITASTKPGWLSLIPITGDRVTTFAGSGSEENTDGTGTAAGFGSPRRIATDSQGNIYVTEIGDTDFNENYVIRKITPSGVVTRFAGSGNRGSADGTGTNASFFDLYGVVTDASDNIYVVDRGNQAIRKITPSGVVTTFAGSGNLGSNDGTGTYARFNSPQGIAIDASGNLYVADTGNRRIRKISPSGVVSTIAGSGARGNTNGTGTSASFYTPTGLVVDASGNIYVADSGSHLIRKITPEGVVSTLAGGSRGDIDGTGFGARFYSPTDLTVDKLGNLLVADQYNRKIRKVSPLGVVTTLAGSQSSGTADGTGTTAGFGRPTGITVGPSGNVYVVDMSSNKIRKIISESSLLAGDPAGQVGSHNVVLQVNDGNGGVSQQNFTIEVIAAPDVITGVAASISPGGTTLQGEVTSEGGASITERGFVYARTSDDATPTVTEVDGSTVFKVTVSGTVGTFDMAVNGLMGNTAYSFVAYADNGGVTEGDVQTFTTLNNEPTFTSTAVTGVSEANTYSYLVTTEDADGDLVAVTALTEPSWLSLTPLVGNEVTTFAGSGNDGVADGTGTDASFSTPTGIAVDSNGNIFVAQGDLYSRQSLIRKISPSGVVSTFAGSGNYGSADGTGTEASFNGPTGVAIDASDNIYVTDRAFNRIRKISPSGVVTTIAGSGGGGSIDGTGTAASFNRPYGIVVDASGNVYIGDTNNHKIRKISPSGVVSTFAGSGNRGFADGTGISASFNTPTGLAIDALNNVYVADGGNYRIRKISPTGVVSTLAGGSRGSIDGTGTNARFYSVSDMAIDPLGNVYVTDGADRKIRKVSPSGVVTTLAGSGSYESIDGVGTAAAFYGPAGIALDASGNAYIVDRTGNRIRKISSESSLLSGDPTGQRGSHDVVLEARDGNGGTAQQSFTIVVTDGIDPVFTSAISANFAENETGTVYTAVATDADQLTYGLGDNKDEGLFNIDPVTGILSFISSPDFESPGDNNGDNQYLVDVIASDATNPVSQTVTITVTDVDEILPVFTSGMAVNFAENGTGTAYTISATDANPVTYGLGSGNDETLFDISGGVVTFKNAPDFEAPIDADNNNIYVIEVQANDGLNTANQTVIITVTDVAEDNTLPVFTSGTAVNFAENGTGTAYTISATDANPVTYGLGSGNDEALFDISGGVVTFKNVPDFEAPGDGDTDNAYVIEVQANDGINTAIQTVTITVTDIDEVLPVFTSGTAVNFAENGTGTAYTISATDANPVTYGLGSGNDEALFDISGGVVTFKNAPDFEAPGDGDTDNAYVIEVQANDGINTAIQTVTITVTDIDEVLPVFTSGTAVNFAENGTGTAYTISATDANPVTYGLGSGNDEALFDISGGVVTFKNAPDFEAPGDGNTDNAYVIEVQANDGINTAIQTVTISVTDLPEDITPPAKPVITGISDDTGASNSDGVTSDRNIIISGTAEAHAVVEVFSQVGPLRNTQADANGDWVLDITDINLIEFKVDLTAEAVDLAGNRSVTSDVFELTPDFTAPAKPVITGITDDTGASNSDGITSDRNIIISGTAEAHAVIEVFSQVGPLRNTQADANGDWVLDITDINLIEFKVDLTAEAVDLAGNRSVTSDVFELTPDFTAPAKPVITGITDDTGASNSDGITNDRNIIISGTAEAHAVVEVFSQVGPLRNTQADANGDWVLDITDINLIEFKVDLTAEAVDLAGNRSVTSDVFELTPDFTAPAKPVITGISDDTGASDSDGVTSDRNIIISGTAEAHAVVEVFSQVGPLRNTEADANGDWVLDITDINLIEFKVDLTAEAVDLAGNRSVTSDVFELTPDFTAPAKPVITGISDDTGASNSDGVTSDRNIIISGTAEAHAVVEVFSQVGPLRNTQADANGDWVLDITDINLIEFKVDLTAEAVDLAGNRSATSDVFVLTPDFTAPGVSISVSGSSPAGYTIVAVFDEDVTGLSLGEISVTGGTASNLVQTNSTSYSFMLTLSGSTVDVQVDANAAQDLAGNNSTVSNQLTLGVPPNSALEGIDNLPDLIKTEQIKLYPNPASTVLTIDLSALSAEEVDVLLYNASGKPVFSTEAYKAQTLKLDVSNYLSGMYIVQVYDGQQVIRKKVMVRK